MIGTKRVSLEPEPFDPIVRAWASSRNMKISASIVVLLGAWPRSPGTPGDPGLALRPVGAPYAASVSSKCDGDHTIDGDRMLVRDLLRDDVRGAGWRCVGDDATLVEPV